MTARYRKILLYILILAVMIPAFPTASLADGREAPAPAYFDIEQSLSLIHI